MIPGLGLAAAAVVGLGGGVAFLGASAGKRSDAGVMGTRDPRRRRELRRGRGQLHSARCPTLLGTARADDALHDVAVGAFVVGGAAAVASAAYFFWPQRASSGKGLQVTPTVGVGRGAVSLSGSSDRTPHLPFEVRSCGTRAGW